MTGYIERKTTADDTVSAYDAEAVTKSDTTVLKSTRGLWVGGAGNVAVTMNSGNVVTFTGVLAGTLLPIQVTQVRSTNTTATTILALY